MEKVKLKFYDIEKCGYYRHGDEEGQLTNVKEVLDNLKQWLTGKTLQQTLTTNFLSAGSERLPVYCANVTKSHSKRTYLLVTWNEVESSNGGISSISKDEPLATVASSVQNTGLPAGHIPGYATYFWFIPEDNILATIRFNHINNGHYGMNYYLKGFLTRFSKYAQLSEVKKGEYEISGYGIDNENIIENIYPQFNSSPKKLEGRIDYIKSKRNSIRKIIKKTILENDLSENKTFKQKILKNIGFSNTSIEEPLKMKYEFNFEPTRQELDDIINNWNKENRNDSWDDIGFKLEKEATPLWLKSVVPSEDIDLNVIRTNDEFIDFNRLLIDLESRLDLSKRIYKGE